MKTLDAFLNPRYFSHHASKLVLDEINGSHCIIIEIINHYINTNTNDRTLSQLNNIKIMVQRVRQIL